MAECRTGTRLYIRKIYMLILFGNISAISMVIASTLGSSAALRTPTVRASGGLVEDLQLRIRRPGNRQQRTTIRTGMITAGPTNSLSTGKFTSLSAVRWAVSQVPPAIRSSISTMQLLTTTGTIGKPLTIPPMYNTHQDTQQQKLLPCLHRGPFPSV